MIREGGSERDRTGLGWGKGNPHLVPTRVLLSLGGCASFAFLYRPLLDYLFETRDPRGCGSCGAITVPS